MDRNPRILRADSLVKRFGELRAVDDISFEIFRGEIFGFLGPNGAGKTTTIRMMSGLLKPDSGNISLFTSGRGRSIGICPQHIVIWENMTCIEQVMFMGRMFRMSTGEIRKRSEELLESLGLTSVRKRLAKSLSGGMQRRLNIALALIHSPEIVFLDEPQAGLDPQSRVLVRDYIKSIKETTTVVLTTHDMEEAEKLSDRICIIDKGKLLVTGTSEEITRINGYESLIEIEYSGETHGNFFSDTDPSPVTGIIFSENRIQCKTINPQIDLEKILEAARVHRLEIRSLQLRRKSLEDIFIDLTGRSIRE